MSKHFTIPAMGTTSLVLAFPDLGSVQRHDLDRVKKKVMTAIAESAQERLDVYLRVPRGGASLAGILAAADALARSQGVQFRLHGVAPQIREILVHCRLEHLIASTE